MIQMDHHHFLIKPALKLGYPGIPRCRCWIVIVYPIHNQHEIQLHSIHELWRYMPRFETKQLGVLEERRAKATAAGTATASCKACRFSMGDRQFLEGSMMRIHKNPLGVGGALFSILFVQAM